MWFKNLILYRMATPYGGDPETIAQGLAQHAFRPCGGLEPFSYGWDSPLGRHGSALVHAANGRTMVCARKEERLMPPAVIREAVEERIATIEAEEGRSVHRKEQLRLRDEAIFDLLPRAFTRSVRTFGYLCPVDGWAVVDAATPQRAEELVLLLGQSVEGLDVIPYQPDGGAVAEMTRWLSDRRLPTGLALERDCELRDPADEGALVRCQRQDLTGDEIRAHLRAHKQVHRLGLRFDDRLTFILGADLSLKRLRFEAVEELDAADAADEAARFDADFAFMTATLAPLLARLLSIFGEAS